MSELKPCPWCGRVPEIIRNRTIVSGEVKHQEFYAFHPCRYIGSIETWKRDTEAEAIEAWNRRANDADN